MVFIIKYIEYMQKNSTTLAEYAQNHAELVVIAVTISLLLWVPLGMVIATNEKWASRTMEIANTIFCIPSIALFALMITIPFLGLSRTSAIVALVLYAMMPLVRNVYQGIKGVDKSVIEAAKGMGMSSRRILFEIQLPLAAPIIFAGFRITVVMTTGIAAIATFIGERNIGRLIVHGLSRSNSEMIIVGAIIIAIIAILLDSILGFFEKKAVPKGLRIPRC